MGNIGWQEMLVIMVFALVIFGPKRLPEIARQVGKAIREVRKVSGQFQDEVRAGLALDDETFPYMKGPSTKDRTDTSVAPGDVPAEPGDLPAPGATTAGDAPVEASAGSPPGATTQDTPEVRTEDTPPAAEGSTEQAPPAGEPAPEAGQPAAQPPAGTATSESPER